MYCAVSSGYKRPHLVLGLPHLYFHPPIIPSQLLTMRFAVTSILLAVTAAIAIAMPVEDNVFEESKPALGCSEVAQSFGLNCI